MLSKYLSDALDLAEVEQGFRRTARRNTFYLEQYLAALETILNEPQPPGTLLRLVEYDANWGIDHDQTDNGAADFLREIANLLRVAIEGAHGH